MSVEQVFFVTVSQGQYLIDGERAPTIDLISGKTYQFDLSDTSVASLSMPLKTEPLIL